MTAPVRTRLSPNHDARPPETPVEMLVLHDTGMANAAAALARLCDSRSKVSAHYLIEEDGSIHPLVAEDRRAWHAGAAFWRGHADVNGRSIGVELANPGHQLGYRPYPEAQVAALEELARDLLARHPIPARNVVGHSEVAPRRKRDPGQLFPWRRLAAAGIGLWPEGPEGTEAAAASVEEVLSVIGYETVQPAATLRAFQCRYRPARVDGRADGETRALLAALLRLTGSSIA